MYRGIGEEGVLDGYFCLCRGEERLAGRIGEVRVWVKERLV